MNGFSVAFFRRLFSVGRPDPSVISEPQEGQDLVLGNSNFNQLRRGRIDQSERPGPKVFAAVLTVCSDFLRNQYYKNCISAERRLGPCRKPTRPPSEQICGGGFHSKPLQLPESRVMSWQ